MASGKAKGQGKKKWAPKSGGPSAGTIQPEGKLRKSQVVTTFGAGAMVDLLADAVLIGGLDVWPHASKGRQLHEPRLRDALAAQFQKIDRKLSVEAAFIEPPVGDDSAPRRDAGIPVLEFPRWFTCQNPRCRALMRSDGLDRKGSGYIHRCDGREKKEAACVPVRFVAACPRGHIEDFPWIAFVHVRTEKSACAAPSLTLTEGRTGDFAELVVSCACGARRRLIEASVWQQNPTCGGYRPWLGYEGREDCSERLRLLVRTASNAYFSQVVSALAIPEKQHGLRAAVQSVWDVLQGATSATLPVFRTIEKVQKALAGQHATDAEIVEAVEQIRSGEGPIREPIRTEEYLQFAGAPPETEGELPPPNAEFFARSIPLGKQLPKGIARVVAARKLREVVVQIGFTRLDAASPDLQGEYDLGVATAPLGLNTDWLPAIEVKGEGLFLQLDETAVREWENRPSVQARGKMLLAGYDAWAKDHAGSPPFPGMRYYLLHSLSHLLVSALALECGYAASALKERIYCAPADAGVPMAALLLLTGTPGSEGTLGGLVEQGKRLRHHLERALDMGRLCSNDPVCASHSPAEDLAERFREGAACHGCLFVAECSCERFNQYLDRALVVPVIGLDDAAFFRA